nr:glycosyltransferase family 2 protein [uncultured Bacteroides sp.]
MKISIITINYNNADGLVQTIESVKRQTFSDYEWIVIDGGSTDGSKEVILKNQKLFSYWCSEKDNGVYNAMNKGIRRAVGNYLFFLNSGDYFHDSTVLEDVKHFLESGEDIVYGDLLLSGGELDGKELISPDLLDIEFFFKTTIGHQACFIKRPLLQESLYNENLKLVSDFEFLVKKIVFEDASYKHVRRIISVYDVCGISSDGETCIREREDVLHALFPSMVYDALRTSCDFKQKVLYPLFCEYGKTHRLQRRVKPLLAFLLKLDRFFSKKKK